MPDFDVTFTRQLNLIGRFTIKAKDDEQADTKAQQFIQECIDDTPIGWTIVAKSKKFQQIEWEEDSDDFDDVEVNQV